MYAFNASILRLAGCSLPEPVEGKVGGVSGARRTTGQLVGALPADGR